jgi:hypothetical protein
MLRLRIIKTQGHFWARLSLFEMGGQLSKRLYVFLHFLVQFIRITGSQTSSPFRHPTTLNLPFINNHYASKKRPAFRRKSKVG